MWHPGKVRRTALPPVLIATALIALGALIVNALIATGRPSVDDVTIAAGAADTATLVLDAVEDADVIDLDLTEPAVTEGGGPDGSDGDDSTSNTLPYLVPKTDPSDTVPPTSVRPATTTTVRSVPTTTAPSTTIKPTPTTTTVPPTDTTPPVDTRPPPSDTTIPPTETKPPPADITIPPTDTKPGAEEESDDEAADDGSERPDDGTTWLTWAEILDLFFDSD